MKYKKLMLVALLLLAILTIGAVSAADNTNDTLTADNAEELSQDLDDEIISVEETDIQAKEIDDDKLTAGAVVDNSTDESVTFPKVRELLGISANVVDNSTDESVTFLNGTLILTDIDTGDVVRKNITIGPFKSNYTNPRTTDWDTINETFVNQILDLGKIQSGGRNITLIKQDFSNIVVDRWDYRTFELVNDTELGRYFLISGTFGTIWLANVTIEAQYASSDRIISFNATGGEGVMENTSVKNNTNYTLPECGFTKEYRVFYGWNVGDAIKQPGENITVTDNLIIKTVWKRDIGGSGNPQILNMADDLSTTSIAGILVLTDLRTSEVLIINYTFGPVKSNYSSPDNDNVSNGINETVKQLLALAYIQARGKDVTVKNQTLSSANKYQLPDNRKVTYETLYEGADDLIQDNSNVLVTTGNYGTVWSYPLLLEAEFESDPQSNINVAKVVLSKNTFTYNGKVQKPTVSVISGSILKEGVDYTVVFSSQSPKKAGTYTITVIGTGAFTGTTQVTFKINKAANPLKVKAKTVKVKFSKLKKKAQKLKVTKVVKFTKKGQGTLTYKIVKGNKKITINKKTGKVTIKKGLKKGTYKVKVKIKANGNVNYKASAFKTITFKIKIK